MNQWIFFALLAPVFLTFSDILTKKANTHLDEYTLAWFRNLFSLPVFAILLFKTGIPSIDPNFWKFLLLIMPVELSVTILYFKSIKVSPISITAPFGAFHPLFLALGAFFILGETIKANLFIPLLLLVIGAYIINLKISYNLDLLAPFKKIGKERGPLLMLLSGLLFGITVPVGKLLVGYSSAEFYTLIYFTTSTVLFTPIFLSKTKNAFKEIKSKLFFLLFVGLCNGLFLILQWLAYSKGPVGPTAALNKLSILFTIILAGVHLDEREIKEKIIASLFMIAGAVLIVLSS